MVASKTDSEGSGQRKVGSPIFYRSATNFHTSPPEVVT